MNISAIGFCSKTARICILILSATLGSSLLGWGSASFSFPPPTRHLVGIDVQPSDADALVSSDTPFSATGTFDKKPTTVENVSAVWISSDPTIVTVDSSSGVASCVAVGGPITITASAGGKTDSANLSCLAVPPSAVGHCVYVCGSTRCGEMTGYCASSDGGACHKAYDPVHCRVGQPSQSQVTDACGVGVDTTSSCTP